MLCGLHFSDPPSCCAKCMLSCIMSLSADGLTHMTFKPVLSLSLKSFHIGICKPFVYLHCFRFLNCFASKQLGVLIKILQFEEFSSYQCL